ncbi:MAG: ClpXP protease specificity-enhancing factor SspB [Bradymonadia bacterium]
MTTRFPTESERAKRAKLDTMLADGLVYVHLDARPEEVEVPDHLKGEMTLTLSLSRKFRLETFELGPLAVRVSLSFNGERFPCVLPWSRIFAFTSEITGERVVYPEDLPLEIQQAMAQGAVRGAPGEEEESAETSEAAEASDAEDPSDEPPEDPPPTGPRLRLVK